MIRETIERNGIVPKTVHAGPDTSVTSKKVSQLPTGLGVTRSCSRPRGEQRQPVRRKRFRTTTCGADHLERFDSLAHARQWTEAFISYYNHEHRHSGIGLHTPASVHFGTAYEVRDQRAVTLAEACERHSERCARRSKPPEMALQVRINDPINRAQL
ncbi:integrase core domain-containing protein [Streptomyces sp. NPDC052042]|uniref:integrase core domain-containing protein n=1 Tax=Streptomyces sp. NPDC052042 TaxID=3365683 RepID=UPI0037D26BE5